MTAKKNDPKDYVMVNGIRCTTAAPLVEIDKLIPYEKNAKVHGSELEILKNQIKDPQIGFRDPIEVDGDMIIVQGHGRRLVALELGMDKVPCLIHKDMHGEASDVYRLASNRASDLAGYDFDILNAEQTRLQDLGWDMESLGFEDMSKYDDLIADDTAEEFEDLILDTGTAEGPTDYKLMVHFGDQSSQEELYRRLIDEGYMVQKLN